MSENKPDIYGIDGLQPDTQMLLAYTEFVVGVSKALDSCKSDIERRQDALGAYIAAHATTLTSMMGLSPDDCMVGLEYALNLHKGSTVMSHKPKPEVKETKPSSKVNWGES